MIKEAIGRDRNTRVKIAKILPFFEQCICTGHGISEKRHRGALGKLIETRQGNKFLGELCRDTSCLIIKKIEELELGFEFNFYFVENAEQIVAIFLLMMLI